MKHEQAERLVAAHRQLEILESYLKKRAKNHIGFPGSSDFDYQALQPHLGYLLNNVGDPYHDSTYALHTKQFEKEVIAFFADLFRAPANDRWGYVTNGGTEGNMYALFLARELYSNGIVYHSAATHYSVQKSLHVLRMPSVTIRTQQHGEIDYDDLAHMIGQHRDRPAIVFANIGTTMHEARDNVRTIRQVLESQAISQHYIHSDAALSGTLSAVTEPHHPFDFVDGADSVVTSGHKFIGSPMPCGVVVVRKSHKDRIGHLIPYIGTPDTTLSGSRNGHTPLFLWYAVQKHGVQGFRKRAKEGIKLADYTLQRLKKIGWESWRNPGTLTVMLAPPPKQLIAKWQLATAGDWSHIICMPGMTKRQVDRFMADLEAAQG